MRLLRFYFFFALGYNWAVFKKLQSFALVLFIFFARFCSIRLTPVKSINENKWIQSLSGSHFEYLLLTEFEVRTVSCGPSFFPFDYGPSAKRAGHKSTGKKRGSLTYSTDRENEVSKIFITSLRLIERVEKVIFKVSGLYSKVLVGGTVASWLARSTPERALRVRALAGDIVLCSWARHFTLTVPLSTQVYKWVPANLMLGGNPAMD